MSQILSFYRSAAHRERSVRRIRNKRLMIIVRAQIYWEAEISDAVGDFFKACRDASVAFKKFHLALPPELMDSDDEGSDQA